MPNNERKYWLKVNSFEELMKHEKEIVEIIEKTPNGAKLFIAHPFMLLADIGVYLSKDVKKEIIDNEPHLSALSEMPYVALKMTKEKQTSVFHLYGLFQRRSN